MNNILLTGTIIVILLIIIIIYNVILVNTIKNEADNIRQDNHRFKNEMMKMYSENVSDIIIENQKTVTAINNFLNEPK